MCRPCDCCVQLTSAGTPKLMSRFTFVSSERAEAEAALGPEPVEGADMVGHRDYSGGGDRGGRINHRT